MSNVLIHYPIIEVDPFTGVITESTCEFPHYPPPSEPMPIDPPIDNADEPQYYD